MNLASGQKVISMLAPRSKNKEEGIVRGMLFFWLLRMAMGKGLELVSSLGIVEE